jgi:mycothiol system anti-sigma-R factor
MWFGSEDLSEISCEEVLKEVELYLDGELDPDRAAHLREHLTGCSPCLDRAEFQQKLKEIIRAKVRCEAPDTLVVRVRQVIRAEMMVERPVHGQDPTL